MSYCGNSYPLCFLFLVDSYRDILHCNKKPFYLKGLEEDSSIMDAYIMHSVSTCFCLLFLQLLFHVLIVNYCSFIIVILERVVQLNHIFRTRDLVTKNDAKVSKNKENSKEEILIGGGFLDQGFTRPKVEFGAYILFLVMLIECSRALWIYYYYYFNFLKF